MWRRRLFSRSTTGGIGGAACPRASCVDCPVVNGCLSSHALFKPLPWWYWGVIGATTAVSVYVASSPSKSSIVSSLQQGVLCELEEGPARTHVVHILDQMGVSADNVKILLTRGGHPAAVGNETDGVLLLPEDLVALMEPNSDVHVESPTGTVYYSGKVAGLSDDVRRYILDREGLLILSSSEIDYILGHEAAHLRHRDSLRKPLTGLVFALGTHGVLKAYNYAVMSPTIGPVSGLLSRVLPFLRPVGHPLIHCALAVGGFLAGSYMHSQHVERQADIASASTLHLEDVAVSLTEKKILRNQAERRHGRRSILANGNDLKEWDHPPLTTQLEYLKRL